MNRNICKFNPSRSSDLICEKFIYEAYKAQSEPSKTADHVLNIVIKGEGTLRVNGSEYRITEGVVFFLLRGETFSVTSDTELEYSYISFNGRRADEYVLRLGIDRENRMFYGFDVLIPFWKSSIEMCSDGNVDVLSEAVLLYSIAVLMPEKKDNDIFVSEVTELVHEYFNDSEFTIGVLAEMMGYSAKYLSSMFKKKMGVSFIEYLREMRLRHALFLMENGVVSVKNVALLCGYKDSLYFSKLFAKHTGKSPKEYIEMIALKQKMKKIDD